VRHFGFRARIAHKDHESVYRFSAWRCEVVRISAARVDTVDCGIRIGGSRRPLMRVAVAAIGLLIIVIAAGCGGSDESPKAQATSEPTVAANIELLGGRIAFRRFLDDAQTHGAIFTIKLDGSDEDSSPIRPLGMSTSTPTGRPTASRSPSSAARRASRARSSPSPLTAALHRRWKRAAS